LWFTKISVSYNNEIDGIFLYWETLLKAIEKMIEYLLDNNLLNNK